MYFWHFHLTLEFILFLLTLLFLLIHDLILKTFAIFNISLLTISNPFTQDGQKLDCQNIEYKAKLWRQSEASGSSNERTPKTKGAGGS